MAVQASIFNLLYFVGRLAPMMMVFFFVFVSIVNQDWRGVLYLSGVVFACAIAILTSNTFLSLFTTENDGDDMCSLTEKPISKIPLSSVILGFTIFYLVLPMMQKYGEVKNPFLVLAFLFFGAVDVFFLVKHNCSILNTGMGYVFNAMVPILTGYIFGFIIAQIYVLVLTNTNNGNLLYYSSDKGGALDTKCNMSNGNKFKCKVYKNGELLTN
jgi:hypothetical protein